MLVLSYRHRGAQAFGLCGLERNGKVTIMPVQRPPRRQFVPFSRSQGQVAGRGKLLSRALWRQSLRGCSCSQGLDQQPVLFSTAAEHAFTKSDGTAAGIVGYSDRAEAHLKQGFGVKALQEASKALEECPGHVQSIVCKSRALVLLQHYEAAVECLEQALKLPGITEDSKQQVKQQLAELEAVRLRKESLHGSHDFAGALLLGKPGVFADFVGPVTVAMTPDGKGRGLFATRDVCKGELLLVANATVYCKDKYPGSDSDPELLLKEAVRSCLASSKAYRQLLAAVDSSKVPAMDDYRPNVVWWLDEDSTQLDVVKIGKAMQGWGDSDIGAAGHGVWSLPALMNHSCLPNVQTKIVNRAMFVRACKDISSGEELMRKYQAVGLPLHAGRTAKLKFECSCSRCKLESGLNSHLEDLGREYSRCKSMSSSTAALLGYLEIAVRLEERMKALELDLQEKDWLRASYNEAYYGASLVPAESRVGVLLPDNAEIMAALVKILPGDTFETMLNFGKRSQGAIVVPTEKLQGRELLEMLIFANCGQLPPQVMEAMVRFLAPGWMTRLNPSYLSSLIVRNAHQ